MNGFVRLPPDLPAGEEELRLQAVRRYDILDTPRTARSTE